jgi:FtsZ-binding cell division protein ZapB
MKIYQKRLEDLKNKKKLEERKQIEFSEKIDELNQETDTLLDEIDKWQM